MIKIFIGGRGSGRVGSNSERCLKWGGGGGRSLRNLSKNIVTLFDMGGGHDGPPNVFDHCAQALGRRKLKLGNF